jgi:exopolysaccharide/PEP-CTERM locus tyrosine autokinase
MGKIFKALQKSKKERRSAAIKPKGIQGSRREVVEQTQKTTISKQEIKRPDIEQPKSDSSEIDLGAIHSLLDGSSHTETPDKSAEIAKEELSPRATKMNSIEEPYKKEPESSLTEKELSSMHKTIDKQSPTHTPALKKPGAAGKELRPEPIGKDLSTITELSDDKKPVDTPATATIQTTEKQKKISDADENNLMPKKVETDNKIKKQAPVGDKKVIPMSKRKAVEPVDKDAVPFIADETKDTDSSSETVLKKYNPSKIDHNLVALLKPDSFEAEQFRMLRSNLLFPLEGEPPRTILVTSAVPGEGKSFVSTNLAVTYALDIQYHVLLIDCDVRKPSIHKLFGYQNVYGLSEYLRGKMEVSSILLNTNITKLKILPGGKPPKNPSELLSSRRMSNLLKEVKAKYPDRYIIIDSPPPTLTAETNVLSRQVDGIVLVASYGSTRREDLVEVIDKFSREKILGIVINRFNLRTSRFYGYGKYGNYKYYYGKEE